MQTRSREGNKEYWIPKSSPRDQKTVESKNEAVSECYRENKERVCACICECVRKREKGNRTFEGVHKSVCVCAHHDTVHVYSYVSVTQISRIQKETASDQ